MFTDSNSPQFKEPTLGNFEDQIDSYTGDKEALRNFYNKNINGIYAYHNKKLQKRRILFYLCIVGLSIIIMTSFIVFCTILIAITE